MSAYYNEIEPFCVAVLETLIEHGEIPHGVVDSRDIRTVRAAELRDYQHVHLFAGIAGFAKGFVDAGFPDGARILTFGFPCQDLSVAGKRGGLSASRSGLFFEAARIIGEVKPDWFICENVPGLFSSGQGKDFQLVVQTLSELGYGLAWRILDSQYFGVAQRRRRVFIVGRLGGPCPAEILFESQGLRGYPATRPKTGQEITRETGISLASGSPSVGTIQANCGTKWWLGDQEAFKGDYFVIKGSAIGREPENGPQFGEISEGACYTLNRTEQHAIAFNWQEDRNFRADERNTNPLRVQQTEAVAFQDHANPIRHNDGGSDGGGPRGGSGENLVCSSPDSNGVRDFAGLPEGMDSPRYKALGNAVTTKVICWIARRIKTYIETEQKPAIS